MKRTEIRKRQKLFQVILAIRVLRVYYHLRIFHSNTLNERKIFVSFWCRNFRFSKGISNSPLGVFLSVDNLSFVLQTELKD